MNSNNTTRLIPVPQWPEYHPWPTKAGLRWLIYQADLNGFNKVVKRAGNRVLICEKSFFEWVERTNSEFGKKG